jgi:hypothetical protein
MVDLPRGVRPRPLAGGRTGFYWIVATYYRKQGCTIPEEPLGEDYSVACERAKALNALFDEWRAQRSGESLDQKLVAIGTVDWLFREYKTTKAYLEKVSKRSRPDYERTMQLVTDITTKTGDRVGARQIRSITPKAADRIYEIVLAGPEGIRPRQAEKVVGLCARAWSVVHRLHPALFDRDVPNPWRGVTKNRRTKAIKPHATRDQVYVFAQTAIDRGYPEIAAAAVICFEWLQRPENVIGGYIGWTDYRGKDAPKAIRIFHHKTGAVILHPLEDTIEGETVLFYADAEAVLAEVPRRGIPVVLHETRGKVEPRPTKLYAMSSVEHIVQRLRRLAKLPPTFTLDACRHGGMTELEEAELTDGQGRALSAHKSKAYDGYAKRTEKRALAATWKRYAHRLANDAGTKFRNKQQNQFRNGGEEQKETAE